MCKALCDIVQSTDDCRANTTVPAFISLTGTFGFVPATDTVDENTAGPFSVCVELIQGALRSGETVSLDVSVSQGVALGGDAVG